MALRVGSRILLVAVALALPLTGCTYDVSDLKDRLAGEEPPRPDETFLWETFVGPQFAGEYPFGVEDGARSVTVDLALSMTSPLPADFPATLAQVTVTLRDPNGDALGEPVTLDPQTPTGSITATNLTVGGHQLEATGMGFSGNDQGARLNASLVVAYGSDPGNVK